MLAPWYVLCGSGFAGALAGLASWSWASAILRRPLSGKLLLAACGALLWVVIVCRFGLSLQAAELCLLSVALLTLSLTDVSELLIPNECVVAAIAIRLTYIVLAPLFGAGDTATLASFSLVGAIAGLVPMLALTLIMDRVLGRESMGGGDIKLLAVGGMFVGWKLLAPLLLVACFGGLATSVLQASTDQEGLQPFPFGPAIAASLVLMCLVGPWVERALLLA